MTLNGQWFFLSIQPEPWRVPPMSPGRKGGKLFVTSGSDEQLVTYQEGVKDLVRAHDDVRKWEGRLKLTFYYRRQLGKGIAHADVTNMNKALEDALQGVLYENDRTVKDVRGVEIEQSTDVTDPYVIVHIEKAPEPTSYRIGHFPPEIFEVTGRARVVEEGDNVWPPRS